MSDYEKIVFLCREVGKIKLFIEMGYTSAQCFYEWRKFGIPDIAKPRINLVFKKYKKLLETAK
jgi:hypothetical protein